LEFLLAEFSTDESKGYVKTHFKIQTGERISICRCFQSQTFPYCDGIHKTLGIKIGPVSVEAVENLDKQENLK
jgi:CDGSH-type Zn-finger protein